MVGRRSSGWVVTEDERLRVANADQADAVVDCAGAAVVACLSV